VAVMPMGICEPYLEKKLIRKVDTDIEIVRPIHIIYNKKKKLSTTVRKTIHISFKFLQDYRDDD